MGATLIQKKTESILKKTRTIVIVVACCCGALLPGMRATASSFILNPSSGSYAVGSVIPVDVFVDTEGVAINAVSGTIAYPAATMRPISTHISDSLVNLWVQPPSVIESDNQIIFEGLILNPGFSGRGKIVTINFVVHAPGSSAVSFVSGLTLANDGLGTNVLSRLPQAVFTTQGSAGDTIARATSSRLSLDPSALVLEGLRPPVVTGYTMRPKHIGDFSLQGVTYPHAVVTLRIMDHRQTLTSFAILADAAGNFTYRYNDAHIRPLLHASALSALRTWTQGRQYRFWLTAKVGEVETVPTQTFDMIIGGVNVSEILLGIIILLIISLGSILLFETNLVRRIYRR